MKVMRLCACGCGEPLPDPASEPDWHRRYRMSKNRYINGHQRRRERKCGCPPELLRRYKGSGLVCLGCTRERSRQRYRDAEKLRHDQEVRKQSRSLAARREADRALFELRAWVDMERARQGLA